jgi:hypothetical protein
VVPACEDVDEVNPFERGVVPTCEDVDEVNPF